MADETQQPEQQAFIADYDTMTVTGLTLGDQLRQMRDDSLDLINVQKERAAAAELQVSDLNGQVAGHVLTIGARDREIEALHRTIAKKNTAIEELAATDGEKAKQIESLTIDLGVARMLLKQAKASTIPDGLERLPGGGIRLGVSLDVDEATPLLSWADSAGEDPATYIARQVKDALVAVTSS